MFKRHTISLGVIFTVIVTGIVQIYAPTARGLSSHTSLHSQHINSSMHCQMACQLTVDRRKNQPPNPKDKDDAPRFKPLYFNTVAIESTGVGLLQAGTIWRQSSWMPPDLTLLSGHYSSSL